VVENVLSWEKHTVNPCMGTGIVQVNRSFCPMGKNPQWNHAVTSLPEQWNTQSCRVSEHGHFKRELAL